jgi:hypothetical protein
MMDGDCWIGRLFGGVHARRCLRKCWLSTETQACAEPGRSDRFVVDPRNTIRTVAAVDGVGDEGASSHAKHATLAIPATR